MFYRKIDLEEGVLVNYIGYYVTSRDEIPTHGFVDVTHEIEEKLNKAQQLANICTDWGLLEVEIDGEMVFVYALKEEFRLE